ncbi:MAG: ROK family protein [Alphaproteobacteria bacterium]
MSEIIKENSRISGPWKGANQGSLRVRNERIVLQLIREHGELTKAEATRATGLSANAMSVIFRALEEDGLLLRGEPTRGRIGQPSIPLRLNPEAHSYVTLKVGRRSLELAVVNFVGSVVASNNLPLPFPTPNKTVEFVRDKLDAVLKSAGKTKRAISGMSIAMPFELWNWASDFGAPPAEMDTWRDFDLASAIEDIVPWSVAIENDATAACRGEVVFGKHLDKQDWIYFFVGTFIGGGVVMNGRVFPGRRGNAGGFGPMRVPEQEGGNRLVDHASLVVLEKDIAKNGGDPLLVYDQNPDWAGHEKVVDNWIERAARNLAHATVSSLSVIDFEAVVIDGAISPDIKSRLVAEVIKQLENTDLQGILMPKVEAGQIGHQARTIGAAALLCDEYTPKNP